MQFIVGLCSTVAIADTVFWLLFELFSEFWIMSSSENANTGPSGEPGSSGQAATSISMDQFAELLAAINNTQRTVDSKLAQFQEEVQQGQEEAAAKALKRAKYEWPYAFKKWGQ